MNSEIFSILATALERSAQKDKTPQNRGKPSVSDQKIIESLCQSSEYRKYVEDNLINGITILMNNDKDFVYAEIAKLSTLPITELRNCVNCGKKNLGKTRRRMHEKQCFWIG
jgi:hypothetical protein